MTDHPSRSEDNSPSLSRPSRKHHEPQLGGDAAILHLVECLGSEDREVRLNAAIKLGEIGDARAIETLMSLQEGFGHPQAAKVLANIGLPALLYLASLLGHKNWDVSYHAALGLVRLGDEGIAKTVTLSQSDNPQIRWLAILGLEAVGYPHNTPTDAFIEALYLLHPLIYEFAARMFGKRDDPAVIPQLKALMNDEGVNLRVRSLAAASLAFMGFTDGIELIIPHLGGYLSDPCASALESLGEKAFPILIAGLENWEWKFKIVGFLVLVKHPGVVPAVISGLKSSQPQIRSDAAHILGQRADPRATEALITALEDEVISVQASAAWALRRIGTPEAMAAMEQWRIKLSPDDQSQFDSGHTLAIEHD